MTIFTDGIVDAVSICQIISGIYLVNGIVKIRSYFTERKKKESINTQMMMVHASAYGLYLIGNFVYFMLFTAYSLNVHNQRAWMVF